MNGESLEIQVSDKLDESMFIIICNQLRCKCWMFHDVNYWQKNHPNILIGILGYHQVRIHLRLLRVEFRWLGMLIRKKCGQNKASASAHSLQNKSTWACYLDMLPKYYCYPFCFTAAKIWNKNPIRVFLVWGKMFNGSHLAKTFYNFYTGANLKGFFGRLRAIRSDENHPICLQQWFLANTSGTAAVGSNLEERHKQ